MLLPVEADLSSDRFTLIVSAAWLDAKSPREAVSEILERLIEEFGSTSSPEYGSIRRITVIKSTDKFVQAITTSYSVEHGSQPISGRIGEAEIEHGILLEARRAA
jgi:hypothetical protein